jgi:hypothetical protein
MKESLYKQNDKIKDKEDENYNLILSSQEETLRHLYTFNKNNAIHKFPSSLKLSLLNGIYYLDNHIKFFSFLKFFFGFIFLILPLLSIIYIVYLVNTDKNKFIFFPFFVSICLINCSLLVFVVIKINDSCRMFGILTLSYERIYNFKIIKFIFVNFFIIWFLFILENFVNNYNLLKEKVAQSRSKEIFSRIFNEGTYILRLLFIFLFWDLEKNKDNKYIHDYIGYFEYEDKFFTDFNNIFIKLFIPIITFSACGILKIIFIKTSRGLVYIILFIVIIFFSFYIYFFDIFSKGFNNNKIKEETEEYFKRSNSKYFEIIPITIIILILIILNTKLCLVDLMHKKYYSYQNKSKNNFIAFLVICSFILNTSGYALLLYILYNLFFIEITPLFSIKDFNLYWFLIYLALLLIFTGYAFPFGHYYFKLLYHSTAFECFNHYIKNDFYINSSGNLKKASGKIYQKKKKDKSYY